MMTPAQALANLDGIAARSSLTRADHVALQESTAVLQALIAAEDKRTAPPLAEKSPTAP